MFNRFEKFLWGSLLLLPISTTAMAQMIHWEVSSPVVPQYISGGFITGGFDFNTDNSIISNITVRIGSEFADPFSCFPCNNYAGGIGTFFSNPDGQSGVIFTETFRTGDVIDRDYFLDIMGNNIDGVISPFTLKTPGTFSDLFLQINGFIRLDIIDPTDPPGIFASEGCNMCVTAIGTLIPIPEPETYALILAGLGIIGWRVNCKGKTRQDSAGWA